MAKEYIRRADIMQQLAASDMQKKLRSGSGEDAYAAFLKMVNDAPAADMVEVVRCKDCRFLSPKYDEPDGYYGCDLKLLAIDLDCFCSEGERRENER